MAPWRVRLNDYFAAGRPTRLILWIVAAAITVVCLRYVVSAPPHRLVIATDGDGGYFSRIAESYKGPLAEQGVTLEIVHTNGGTDNLARLESQEVDLAFLHGGMTNKRRSPELESLGSVAYAPLWIVYRASLGELDSLPKLRGHTIGLGREGSGSEVLARTLLRASGVTSEGSTLVMDDGNVDTAVRALRAGKLDAAFVIGPAESPSIRALFVEEGLRVMSSSDAEGLARNLTFLHVLHLPKGTIDLPRQAPDRDLVIVSSTVTIVARKDVHPALVYLLMSVVDAVHEPPSLVHHENEFPSDKDTDLPLSPQAETYYRSGKPFLQRYLPFAIASAVERFLKVAVPILLVVVPFVRTLPAFYRWRVRQKLAKSYRQLLEVERAAATPGSTTTIEEHETTLRAIEQGIQAEKIPILYSNEVYVLREHIELARRHIARR